MNLSGLFGAALSGLYADAVVHRVELVDDGTGTLTRETIDHPCKAQLDAAAERMREGRAETEQRILVLRATLVLDPPLTTDDEISAGGRRWKIVAIAADPAGAAWALTGRRA